MKKGFCISGKQDYFEISFNLIKVIDSSNNIIKHG